ncbi:MAG: hypothetical protein ACYC9M_08250 [Desulfobulbaceae bacterium]
MLLSLEKGECAGLMDGGTVCPALVPAEALLFSLLRAIITVSEEDVNSCYFFRKARDDFMPDFARCLFDHPDHSASLP